MRRRQILLPIALAMLSLIAFSATAQSYKESLRIYGKVVDYYTSEPIFNATIIAIPWRGSFEQRYFIAYTDSEGFYEIALPMYDLYGLRCEYLIYVLHTNSSTGLIDYVPALYPEDVSKGGIKSSMELSFNLVPGALIEIYPKRKADMWYILSKSAPSWYIITPVDSSTFETPTLPNGTVVIYGEPPVHSVKKRLGIVGADIQYLSSRDLFAKNVVIVPADTSIYLVAKMQFLNERTKRKDILSMLIGFQGKSIKLRKGERILVDIRSEMYKVSADTLETLTRDLEEKLALAEQEGFYVGAEREDLQRGVVQNVEAAKNLLPPLNPSPSEHELDAVRFQYLEEAYYSLRLLENRLGVMRALAQSHATFYPPFFAVFSIAIGSFLFEDTRKKLITTLVVYPLIIVSLYYIYPGFRIIMNPQCKIVFDLFGFGKVFGFKAVTVRGNLFFIAVIIASIALTVALYFVFPRIYRPPEIEGRASLKSIITVIFSIGKRNVKRRKLRSSFCILSLAMLVMVLTAFTSFSRVQGIVVEGPSSTNVDVNGCLLEKVPLNATKVSSVQQFFASGELEALKAYGAENFMIRVENVPSNSSVVRLRALSGRNVDLLGVVGLTAEGAEVLGIANYLPKELFKENMSIAITESLARRLGVKPGDKIQVSRLMGGVETQTWNFTLVGYVNPAILGVNDFNGKPIAPYKLTSEGELQPVNATEFAVFNAWTIIALPSSEGETTGLSEKIGISAVFIPMSDENTLKNFANKMALREYYAWVFFNGEVTKVYTGEKWEIKGFKELLVPATLVFLNVFMVMINLVYERRNEMFLLAALGLNPAHIASVFLAESIVMGLIGGGIGYYAGLGAYRLMSLLGPAGQIGVREKLEWYWGVIGLLVSIFVSILSAVVPAIRAAVMATPSLIRKIKIPEAEKVKREEKIFKVYHERSISMPVRVHRREKPFFTAFITDRLKEVSGLFERIENLKLEEEILVDGTEVVRVSFTHRYKEYATINELRATRPRDSDRFYITLLSKPEVEGMPERAIELTVSVVRDALKDWERYKRSLMTGTTGPRS